MKESADERQTAYDGRQDLNPAGSGSRGERTIQAICREANISEVTFHQWKKQFWKMELNEARRLKKMLTEEMLKVG